VAAGVASRQPDGSYRFHASTEEAAPVQRAPEPPAVPDTAVSAAAPTGALSGEQPVEAASAPELDLDVLARRLYPRLRPYLRKELWVGRERAGAITDRRS